MLMVYTELKVIGFLIFKTLNSLSTSLLNSQAFLGFMAAELFATYW
jgi:hypothetical protein